MHPVGHRRPHRHFDASNLSNPSQVVNWQGCALASLTAKSTGLKVIRFLHAEAFRCRQQTRRKRCATQLGNQNCVKSGKCRRGERLENRANNDVGMSVNRVRG